MFSFHAHTKPLILIPWESGSYPTPESFFFFNVFIYFRQHWVCLTSFLQLQRLTAALWLQRLDFSLRWFLLLWNTGSRVQDQ